MKYIEYQRKHEMKMHESVTKNIILKKLASNFRNKWVFPVFVIIITFIVLAYWMIQNANQIHFLVASTCSTLGTRTYKLLH